MSTSILFVCTGNICRSPTAEAVLRQMAKNAKMTLRTASAGTGGWHAGEPPDKRAIAAAEKRCYDTAGITAKQVTNEDLSDFDIIYAMTREHRRHMLEMLPASQSKIQLFLSVIPNCQYIDFPDPYYGGEAGFELMMDLLEEGCTEIIRILCT